MDPGTFLVFGDSHAVIWEGSNVHHRTASPFASVKVFHLGAALAFNLLDKDGAGLGKWGQQIFSHLEDLARDGVTVSGVMLCFGEIDVRVQIVQRALTNGTSIDQEVGHITRRLIAFARMAFEKTRRPILLWEPVPTSSAKAFDHGYPAVGTEVERNYATFRFQTLLRSACGAERSAGAPLYAFGIFDRLTNFFETRTQYFADGCHLNLEGLSIAIEELGALCKTHNLGFAAHFVARSTLLSAPRIRNIAGEVKLDLSSELQGQHGPPSLVRKKDAAFCFHTAREPQPFVMIDIGYAAVVTSLVLHNRFDSGHERAKSLSVYAGNSLGTLKKIHQCTNVWGADGASLTLEIPGEVGPVRYIMLRLTDEEYFHLGEVEIMARTFHRD